MEQGDLFLMFSQIVDVRHVPHSQHTSTRAEPKACEGRRTMFGVGWVKFNTQEPG